MVNRFLIVTILVAVIVVLIGCVQTHPMMYNADVYAEPEYLSDCEEYQMEECF